jgi:hypothetical protein
MSSRHIMRFALLLLLIALPAAATAADRNDRSFVVVGDDGDRVSLTIEGGELTLVTDEDGRTSVRIVDLEQIGTLVSQGLEDALAAVRDMQLEVHMGGDNMLAFSHDDETVELDVNALVQEIGEMLQHGFAEVEHGDWVVSRDRDRTEAELRRELRDLKREMRELRRELERRSR